MLKHSLSIIFVQLFGALISISAAAYITSTKGAAFFGEINAWLGVFALLSTLSLLGVPEYLQKRFAAGEPPIIACRYIPLLILAPSLLILLMSQLGFTSLKIHYSDFLYICIYTTTIFSTEVIARYFFQTSKPFFGQTMMTGMTSSFWIFSIPFLATIDSDNISKMIAISIIPIGVLSLSLLFLTGRKYEQKSLHKENKNQLKSYLNPYFSRVNVVILDWLPVLLLSKSGMFELAGCYALAIRTLMPLSLASSALANYLQKEGLSGQLSISKASTYSAIYLAILVIFGFFCFIFLRLNPFNLFDEAINFVSTNILAISLLFSYRVIYLVFNFISTVFLVWVISASFWLSILVSASTALISIQLIFTFNGSTINYLTMLIAPSLSILLVYYFLKTEDKKS